ncbi:MAG TPA: hypothetical protein PKM69_07085 [Bacteroidales bacterium]|nr:hypothetical protein [Bacteroidales bacterium]
MRRKYIILLFIIFLSSCEKNNENDMLLKFYGDAYENIGYSLAKSDDGYFISGQVTDITRTDNYIEGSVKRMGIIKTGSDGNVIWEKSLGERQPAVGLKVLALDDGSAICAGYVIDTVTLEKDIFVARVGEDGTVLAQKIYKSEGNQYSNDIVKTQEGFLILGTTDVKNTLVTDASGNLTGKKDILLVRINNDLEEISQPVQKGFPGNDEGVVIKADLNGGYIIAGTTDRIENKSLQAGNNILILKVNADGSVTEPRILNGIADEYAVDIEVLNDWYLIAGTIGSDESAQKGYVWGISNNIYADPLFSHEIDLEPSTSIKSSFAIKAIDRYKTNSFVMAGQIIKGSSAQMLIFITDAEGTLVEGKIKVLGGTGTQVAYDVTSDEEDNIMVTGKNSYENNSMISLLKFRF